jgi:hypothetical protein
VFANVAVVNTVNAGYLTINPGGVTTVSASTINWGTSNQTQSNGVSLTLDNARQVTVIAGGPGSTISSLMFSATGSNERSDP